TYTVTGQVAIDPPVFSLPEGIYQSSQTVSINTSTTPAGATVRYTTDGSTPTETSPNYSAPINIPLNTTMTIKAVAFLVDWVPSIVYSATYTVTGQVVLPDPVFTPPAGTYQSAQTITLDTDTTPSGATLRYTLDGSEPTENSPAYTAPINLPLNSTTTISVKGFKTNWIPSETATAQYVITGQVAFQTPVFLPAPGPYYTPQTVTVAETFPDDAMVYYTTDGSEPTATSSVYTDPILIEEDTTLKVKAFKTDWIASVTHTGVYTITGQASIASPVFAPEPGTYQTEQAVSINTQTVPVGAQIRYTMDGSDPNASSPLYTTPIELELNHSYEIRARAFAADWTPSVVYVAQYTITGEVEIPDPVFTPTPGIYTADINVVLNTQTLPAGAILRYSLDGNDPDESYPQYTQPVQLEAPADVTLKVRAYKDDWLPSPVYAAEYTLTGQMQLLPPYLDPPPGIYTAAQSVSPAGGTDPANGIIRYTTDGSDPTQDSPVFDSPIEIGLNNPVFTIKIRAFKENWIPSAVHAGVYTVTGQVQLADDMFSPDPGNYTSVTDVALAPAVMPDNATLR
ncbi:MAG: chitobiase/beta-hexosaminidase C-terminal domain-containing protein, partial [Candidatus Syntrophosphaera sp.]